MKKLLFLVVAAMFSSVAFADDTEDRIAQLDLDKDGLVSKQEASADQEMSAQFEQLDANGDGLLGEDEIDSGPFDDFDEIGEDPVDE